MKALIYFLILFLIGNITANSIHIHLDHDIDDLDDTHLCDLCLNIGLVVIENANKIKISNNKLVYLTIIFVKKTIQKKKYPPMTKRGPPIFI